MEKILSIIENHQQGAIIIIVFFAFAYPYVVNRITRHSIKHEYAMRAPKVPEWFEPKLRTKISKPPYLNLVFGSGSNHPHKELFKTYWNDGDNIWHKYNGRGFDEIAEDDYTIIPQDLKREVAAHLLKLDLYFRYSKEYEQMRKQETIKQWRFFYADLMTR